MTNQVCDAQTDGVTILFHRLKRRIPPSKQHLELRRLSRGSRVQSSWNVGFFAFLDTPWSVCVNFRIEAILPFATAQNDTLDADPALTTRP
ncbi:hypothetical protein KFU94_67850 [Chloroflexi bacterium TSY]|nr:hypothetical protein [Chloroflexi bacterium TSY]